jgi:hypothetical protein
LSSCGRLLDHYSISFGQRRGLSSCGRLLDLSSISFGQRRGLSSCGRLLDYYQQQHLHYQQQHQCLLQHPEHRQQQQHPAQLLIPSKSLSVSASTLTAIYLTICSISEISFSISNRQHLQLLQHHLQQQLQLHISTSIDSINITISMYLNLPEDFVHRFHW